MHGAPVKAGFKGHSGLQAGWAHQYPKLGGKAEPSALPGEGISVFYLFIFSKVMWSFAAAPGSPPLPKETPLSGYLPGNPVPAERSWMEPRRSAVPRGDGTELRVPPADPRAQGFGNARGGSQGPHKAVPNPCPCAAPNLPSYAVFLIHRLQRAHCRGGHGPPPPLQKHSWTTTIMLGGPTPTPCSRWCLEQESHSLRWSWSKKTAWHGRGDSHTEPLMHAEHLLPGGVPHGHLACRGAML